MTSRFVAVQQLVGSAGLKNISQFPILGSCPQLVDLQKIVLVYERLDCIDRTVYGSGPKQGGHCPSQPACKAPQDQQPASMLARQNLAHYFEMTLLGSLMLTRKLAQGFDTRDRANAPVNVDGPGLTGVVGAQA